LSLLGDSLDLPIRSARLVFNSSSSGSRQIEASAVVGTDQGDNLAIMACGEAFMI
jgi:hypothetical protein